mgnify:CR=1 FL=1
MRWGVRDEATDDHLTTALCMTELSNCQRLSVGPNFVVIFFFLLSFFPFFLFFLSFFICFIIFLKKLKIDFPLSKIWISPISSNNSS